MTRLFISFYVFIALALVGLSAALEPLFYDNEDPLPAEAKRLISTLEATGVDGQARAAIMADVNPEPRVIPLASLALSANSKKQLADGKVVSLYYQDSVQLYALADPDSLYEITYDITPASPNVTLYSMAFFVSLAILLALWIWPLWRDLSAITRGLKTVNDDGSLPKIHLSARSVVAPIALAINKLSTQVSDLFSRHKEMTGAVAHELRTPLARLKFALAGEPLTDEEGWQAMRDDVNELERMVQEMLDYLRNDGRPPELNISHIPLQALLSAIRDRAEIQTSTEVNISVAADDSVVLGDGHFVERAIENLVLNALRYAKTRVVLRTEQTKQFTIIHVEDDGPGVSEENREKIFAPFYRPDSARSRERGGAGLGLAIVRRIQHWHDGECYVGESTLGGADFTLHYPTRH